MCSHAAPFVLPSTRSSSGEKLRILGRSITLETLGTSRDAGRRKASRGSRRSGISWRNCNVSGLVDFETLYELVKLLDVLVAVAGEIGIVSQGIEPIPFDEAVHVSLEFQSVFILIGEDESERLVLIHAGQPVFKEPEVAHGLIVVHLVYKNRCHILGRHPLGQGFLGMGERFVDGALLHKNILRKGAVFGENVELGRVHLMPLLRELSREVLRARGLVGSAADQESQAKDNY